MSLPPEEQMLPRAPGVGRRHKQAPTCSCVPDDDSELIGETSVGATELEPHEGKGLGHDLLLAYQFHFISFYALQSGVWSQASNLLQC